MGAALNRILDALRRQGWKVEKTGGGHWRCIPPDPTKRIVRLASTPSDVNAVKQMIRDLRKSGFRWPE